MNIPILLETENFVVINKPAGLVVHGDGKHEEPTVVDWVMKKYPNIICRIIALTDGEDNES